MPVDTVVTVPVLDDDGEKVAGIRALDVLVENQRRIRAALAGIDDRVITVGASVPSTSPRSALLMLATATS